MKPITAVVLNIDPGVLPLDDRILWAVKTRNNGEMTSREYYLGLKKVMNQVDVLVISFPENHPTFDDGVLMQMAYSISTPVFVVGPQKVESDISRELVTNTFPDLDGLVDHLHANYC